MTIEKLHGLWASVIELGIGFYLLWREVTWAYIAPAVIAISQYAAIENRALLMYDHSLHFLNFYDLQSASQSAEEVEPVYSRASSFDFQNGKYLIHLNRSSRSIQDCMWDFIRHKVAIDSSPCRCFDANIRTTLNLILGNTVEQHKGCQDDGFARLHRNHASSCSYD